MCVCVYIVCVYVCVTAGERESQFTILHRFVVIVMEQESYLTTFSVNRAHFNAVKALDAERRS